MLYNNEDIFSSLDINECIANGTSIGPCPDHANCINSVGSYSCECDLGYRLDAANKILCNGRYFINSRISECLTSSVI